MNSPKLIAPIRIEKNAELDRTFTISCSTVRIYEDVLSLCNVYCSEMNKSKQEVFGYECAIELQCKISPLYDEKEVMIYMASFINTIIDTESEKN